ncbi:aldolase [Candidatus Bathyarchaeota archaeon RBG_13_38_9]|nr:MAG: aldolase [Candidatus Bathyarchaeota archaeon RBG_13_38_9]
MKSGSKYDVELISVEKKDELMKKYSKDIHYEERADIYGCCIKLLTNLKYVKERWEENFYPMSNYVRSHGRLVVIEEKDKPLTVLYDPLSKTAFLINVDYYGWVKSLALATAGDILEDEHDINSVHGACIDLDGKGICLIAPSGTGKTTHTYGMLRIPEVRILSDDWFFVRLQGQYALSYGSEKNFYTPADVAQAWNEYKQLVENAYIDPRGRAILNVRWIIGKGRVVPFTTIRKVILLKRDPNDNRITRTINTDEALEFLEKESFCNPHLLVRSNRKKNLRNQFFKKFLDHTEIYMVNATPPPKETNEAIKDICVKS